MYSKTTKTFYIFLMFFSFLLSVQHLNAQPTISSLSSISGNIGASISVTGTGFNSTAANNIVFFGATRAIVTAANTTTLTVTVPLGATFAPITVLNSATGLATSSNQIFNPTFNPNKSIIATNDIATKVDFTTGSNPKSMTIGDIDGDGKPDLVIANKGSNTVSVLRNTGSTGTLSFATKVDFTTGTNPVSVVIGDIDGDGRPDLAIANNGSNTVSVLRNTGISGTLSFATKVDFTSGTNPVSMIIGDIDANGKPDLAIVNQSSNTVSVLRNIGTIGTIAFALKLDFSAGIFPQSIAIGDIDGDSKPDLAVVLYYSSLVYVLRNTSSIGTISFATGVGFSTATSPVSVAIGDMDGDGKHDLIIANSGSNHVSVLRNTSSIGTVNFAFRVGFSTGLLPSSVSIGDINGDGKPDLAIANTNSNTVSVLRNSSSSGTVNFAATINFTTGTHPSSVVIGDLNGDGKTDLAITNYDSSKVSVLRNITQYPPTIISFTPTSCAIRDTVTITGTFFNDTAANNIVFFGATKALVIAATTTSLIVTVPIGATFGPITVLNVGISLVAYSTQFFNPIYSPNKDSITTADIVSKVDFTTGTHPNSLAFGDIDGDGKPDLATTNSSNNIVSILRNTSNSGTVSFAPKLDFSTASSPSSLALGDINGDGKPDLILVNSINTIAVFRNTSITGTVSFASRVEFTTGTRPSSIAIGDIDGDGKSDLVITNFGDFGYGTTVSILQNTSISGSVNFAAKLDFTTDMGPISAAIGDVDGDGKPDLATANFNSTISVLRNTGSNSTVSFEPKVDFTTDRNPTSLAIGDINGDGKPDLVTANSSVSSIISNTVSILRNTGNSGTISFATKLDFTTGTGPNSVAIGDIDGDGKIDLATANNGSGTVSVLRNTSISGSVSFVSKVDFATGIDPNSAVIGDIDGDGKPDLATANTSSASVSVFRNNPQYPPTIIKTGTLFPFSSCSGKASSQQTFTIAGVGLIANVLVTVPTGFEISTTSGVGFGASVSLTPTSGIINNTIVYVRMTSSASGSPSGNTVCTSTGATTKNIVVSGVVNAVTITTSTNNTSICPSALPFTWNGRTYNANTTDTIYLANSFGCDSITILKLTIKSTSTSTNNISICSSALPYIWNSRTYNANITDTVYLTNSVGCDSITILKLTIKPISTSTNNISICPSALPYTWNSRTYNANITDTIYLTNSIGCDSITILKLIVKPTSASTNNISICSSALPFTWNGRNYNTSSVDTFYLTNSFGCDSVTILNLAVKSTSASTTNISICPTVLPFTWNSRTYYANKIDTVYLANSLGCDSLAILILTIKPTSTSTNNLNICSNALPYTWNSRIYNSNKIDTVYLTNSLGCDSLAILILTIKLTSTSTNNLSICSSLLPYTWNGLTFNTAGTQTKTGLNNSVGCDSSATLNLTIKPTSTSTNNVNICSSALPYTWNGLTYNTAGTQTKTGLTNSVGCDSSATLNLTVNPLPNTSNIVGLANAAKLDTASYSVSGLNGSVFNWLVSGATIQSGAGSNQIQVKWLTTGIDTIKVTETSNQGCIGVQKSLSVIVSPTIGMNELKINNQVIIYPNPFSETIQITLLNNLKLEKAIIYDLVGNEIMGSNKNEIDAGSLKSGIYLIMIVDNFGNSYNQKLIKN